MPEDFGDYGDEYMLNTCLDDRPNFDTPMGLEDDHPLEDDSMDGDFDSAMASAGLGTDEDYNHFELSGDF